MKKIQLLFVALISILSVNAQNETILTIAGEAVTKSEFEYVFKKNNTDESITQEELNEYMELFINYKLKVKEAEDLGLDTVPTFVKELDGYRNQLAAPYLTNSKVDEELTEQAYERMQQEVRASHLLIKVSEGALSQDTLAAYNKIADIRAKIVGKEMSFQDAASKYSEDPSAKTNKGDLGYFTAFQMVYPFENAAYNTPVKEISSIIRTRFGYHILEVVDKRKSKGEVKVAHIVIVSNDKMTPQEQQQAKTKIDEIYEKVEQGEDFALLAKQFSDDKGSAQRGGELPMFGPGKMVPEFETEAFKLENLGDFTKPFKSRFGWHIIKLLDVKKLESFEELKPIIEKKIQRDSRSKLSKEVFIQERMKEYGFKEYAKNLAPFYTWVDSSIYVNKWRINPEWKLSKIVFSIGKTKYTQQDFANFLHNKTRRAKPSTKVNMPIETFVNSSYEDYKNNSVMEYEKSRLEEKYPDFKSLLQEYHDGILLFELSDQKVWKKATKDSLGLDTYYQENKLDNMWPDRVEAQIYKSIDEEMAKQVQQFVSDSLSNDSIVKLINKDSQLNLIVDEGLYAKDDEEVFSKIEWKRGISEIVLINSQFIFVNITDVLIPSPKSLDEAKGLYISNYQETLEAEWILSLRQKYAVEINKEVLYTIETK